MDEGAPPPPELELVRLYREHVLRGPGADEVLPGSKDLSRRFEAAAVAVDRVGFENARAEFWQGREELDYDQADDGAGEHLRTVAEVLAAPHIGADLDDPAAHRRTRELFLHGCCELLDFINRNMAFDVWGLLVDVEAAERQAAALSTQPWPDYAPRQPFEPHQPRTRIIRCAVCAAVWEDTPAREACDCGERFPLPRVREPAETPAGNLAHVLQVLAEECQALQAMGWEYCPAYADPAELRKLALSLGHTAALLRPARPAARRPGAPRKDGMGAVLERAAALNVSPRALARLLIDAGADPGPLDVLQERLKKYDQRRRRPWGQN